MRKGLLITASATALLVAGAAQAGTVYEGDSFSVDVDVEVEQWLQTSSEAENFLGGYDPDFTLSGSVSGEHQGLAWGFTANNFATGSAHVGGDWGTISVGNSSFFDTALEAEAVTSPSAGPDEFEAQGDVSAADFEIEEAINPDSADFARLRYGGSAQGFSYKLDVVPTAHAGYYGLDGGSFANDIDSSYNGGTAADPDTYFGQVSGAASYSGNLGGLDGAASAGFSSYGEGLALHAGAEVGLQGFTVGGNVGQLSGENDTTTSFGAGVSTALTDAVTVGGKAEAVTGDTGNDNTHTKFQGGVDYAVSDYVTTSADLTAINDGDNSDLGATFYITGEF